MAKFVGALGRTTILRINRLAELCALTCRLIAIAVPLPRTGRVLIRRVIVEQLYFTAVQALPVIVVTTPVDVPTVAVSTILPVKRPARVSSSLPWA